MDKSLGDFVSLFLSEDIFGILPALFRTPYTQVYILCTWPQVRRIFNREKIIAKEDRGLYSIIQKEVEKG